MATLRDHRRELSRLINCQKPLQLFNSLKTKVFQLRHRRGKPTPDRLRRSHLFGQDASENSPVVVDEDVQWIYNKEYDFASSRDKKLNNEQQHCNIVSHQTAEYQCSSKNVHELIKLAGLKPAPDQGCVATASPKNAPFLSFELVFGVDFPRDKMYCYRARAPIQTGDAHRRTADNFRRQPTQPAGKSWIPGEEPLPEPLKRLACPYLIKDPGTYEGRQGCRGAAFPDSSRLKEHLYRCHKQKPHCTKCGEPFADESGKFLQRFEGFNEEQEAKLKDKKRKRGESNEEKWKDIFKILFPDTVEIPSPYYKSPAHERFQDRTTKTANTKYGFIDDPFESHEPGIESEARSKMEKITGSLPDDVWSEMKEIFRDLAFSGAKAFRTPTAPDTNRHHLKTARTMESQISLCGSSTSSTSHQVRGANRTAGPSNKENLNHEDIQSPVLKGDCRMEDQDNDREPDIADVFPGIDVGIWLSGVGGMFGRSPRPIPLCRPNQASPSKNLHPAHESSQLSQPSQPSEPSSSSTSTALSASSRSGTHAEEAKFGIGMTLSTRGATEDALGPEQEATAEICEEMVFYNLNLTPEECLAAAFQQKMPTWQGPEEDSFAE